MNVLLALLLLAQQATTGTLRVTVVDQTNAIVPGATVKVAGIDEATKAATVAPATTTDQGVAIVPALTPGRYAIQVEFPGFETRVIPDVRVRPGEKRRVATMTIQKIQEAVLADQHEKAAASDRN